MVATSPQDLRAPVRVTDFSASSSMASVTFLTVVRAGWVDARSRLCVGFPTRHLTTALPGDSGGQSPTRVSVGSS